MNLIKKQVAIYVCTNKDCRAKGTEIRVPHGAPKRCAECFDKMQFTRHHDVVR